MATFNLEAEQLDRMKARFDALRAEVRFTIWSNLNKHTELRKFRYFLNFDFDISENMGVHFPKIFLQM